MRDRAHGVVQERGAPAFALDSIVESLPTNTVALEVQFGAYLAVILGTFLPALFLITLFIQTESRRLVKMLSLWQPSVSKQFNKRIQSSGNHDQCKIYMPDWE